MAEVKNYQEVVDIASKHLGKVGGDGYKDSYDPSLLVKIPRHLNREGYGITGEEFVGVDTWNAYEVSAITTKGQPVVGFLKIVCPADSEFHVESKSIKLYLNSFNMTQIADNAADCIKGIEARVTRDLNELLETNTTVTFYANKTETNPLSFEGYHDVGELTNLDDIEFTSYKSDAGQLEVDEELEGEQKFYSDLLRSNCRVTNQPDWGDVYIRINGKKLPSASSLAKYIVSHRTVSHFHEEICEMIYTHLMEAYEPDTLMVACLYTRRGGIDINPIRATHQYLVPEFFTEPDYVIEKTLRQ